MARVPAPSWRAKSCKPSITPYPSHVTGPMTIARLTTVMIAAASFGRSPRCTDSQLYGGIQGHGQNHTPGEYGDEWTNKNERPVNEERQQTQAERKLDDFSSRCRLPNHLLGHRFDLVDARTGPTTDRMRPDRTSPDIRTLSALAQARA